MRTVSGLALAALGFFFPFALHAQQPDAPAGDVSILTIYNQSFAVVRSTVDLDLKPGISEVTTTKVTRQMEPDSVVLRDPKGNRAIEIVEQNYDAAVIDQNRLLAAFEGQTIDFQSRLEHPDSSGSLYLNVPAKIVRAPDNAHSPIIEINGKLQFELPGLPIFPAKADSLLLKPTLRWRIAAEHSENVHAELDYITNGLSWESTYNIVLPEDDKTDGSGTVPADVVGWVTINNQSGTEFPAANIKLMAGDVAKLQPINRFRGGLADMAMAVAAPIPQVTQKAFDDFHLYDLHRTVNLRDGETKQVEFLRAAKVPITRKYEYDGEGGDSYYGLNLDRGFGTGDNKKVTIVQEFKNSEANHLGIPLPAGKLRFYRQDSVGRDGGGQVEFTGENTIDHTPKDGTIRVVTGDAFDITGERRQTDFHVDTHGKVLDETFEIKVKNVKETPVTVSVIEHLYRWSNWKVRNNSIDYKKTDSRTIEFPVALAPNQEKTVTYTAHYSW